MNTPGKIELVSTHVVQNAFDLSNLDLIAIYAVKSGNFHLLSHPFLVATSTFSDSPWTKDSTGFLECTDGLTGQEFKGKIYQGLESWSRMFVPSKPRALYPADRTYDKAYENLIHWFHYLPTLPDYMAFASANNHAGAKTAKKFMQHVMDTLPAWHKSLSANIFTLDDLLHQLVTSCGCSNVVEQVLLFICSLTREQVRDLNDKSAIWDKDKFLTGHKIIRQRYSPESKIQAVYFLLRKRPKSLRQLLFSRLESLPETPWCTNVGSLTLPQPLLLETNHILEQINKFGEEYYPDGI